MFVFKLGILCYTLCILNAILGIIKSITEMSQRKK